MVGSSVLVGVFARELTILAALANSGGRIRIAGASKGLKRCVVTPIALEWEIEIGEKRTNPTNFGYFPFIETETE